MNNQVFQKKERYGLKNAELEKKLIRLGMFLDKHATLLIALAVLFISGTSMAFATTADTLWTDLTNLIGTWVTRLGGVVLFVGAVMFALGWKNDDAEGKSRGVSTLIAGALVMAVSATIGTFFSP